MSLLPVTCGDPKCLCTEAPVQSTPAPQPDPTWFDVLCDDVEEYLKLLVAARDCPKGEQEWRDAAVEESKAALIATWQGCKGCAR